MKNGIFFILLFVFGWTTLFGQSLDSLILKGQKGANRAQHLKSFIPGSGTVFRDTAMIKRYEIRGPDLYATQRIDELEVSVAKLIVICDNLQKQSDSHSDNQEFFLKLIEIISGGVVSIIIAIIGLKFTKKADS